MLGGEEEEEGERERGEEEGEKEQQRRGGADVQDCAKTRRWLTTKTIHYSRYLLHNTARLSASLFSTSIFSNTQYLISQHRGQKSPPPMASSSAGPARLLFNFDESSASSTAGTPPPALPRPPAPTAEDDDADDEDDPVSSHFRDIDERGNRYFMLFLVCSCFRHSFLLFSLSPPTALTPIPQDILQAPPKSPLPLLPLLRHCLPRSHHRPPKSHILAIQLGHRSRLTLPQPQHLLPAEPHRRLS